MDAKTMSVAGWADQAAKLAQDGIARMREYAVRMDSDLASVAGSSAKQMSGGLGAPANKVYQYIEAKPMQAAMIAMAVGVWASRAMKPREAATGVAPEATAASPTKPKVRRRKAAARKAA